MHRQILYDGSAQARCPLGARTQRAFIGVARHSVPCAASSSAEAPAQDAHLLILQLKDHPAHDFWADGRHMPMPPAPKGTLGLVDLRRQSRARFTAEVDSLHLHLPRTALDDLAADIGAAPAAGPTVEGGWAPADPVVRQLAPLLVAALDAPGEAAQPFIDHLVLAVATHVATRYGGMKRETMRPGMLAPWQLRRAQEMLAADLPGRTSLHEVAQSCGLSVSYFSRAFKASTGRAPHGWLQSLRTDHARTLLRDRALPLAEVALRSGFADQSHFNRVFKQATGLAPGAWRRLNASG